MARRGHLGVRAVGLGGHWEGLGGRGGEFGDRLEAGRGEPGRAPVSPARMVGLAGRLSVETGRLRKGTV